MNLFELWQVYNVTIFSIYFVTFFYLVFLGCSAGGIALSTLVPATVSSLSSLAKSSVANLQIWSMHGLLLTIEAAGLSFVSHVQVFPFQMSAPCDEYIFHFIP